MSLATAAASASKPAVGRPRSASIPRERRRHLAVLLAKRDHKVTTSALALMCGVHPRTIQYWARWARAYPEAAPARPPDDD